MPRINTEFLDGVFYLYPSVEAAARGEAAGGTGVFVGVSIPEMPGKMMIYACSNKHVVGSSGCSVMRLNRVDGRLQVIDADPSEWTFDPNNDLAVMSFVPNPEFKMRCVPVDSCITQEEISNQDAIGPGDEVLMIGRFINHDGKLINVPSVRFGHLSMMPLSIRHPGGYDQESFAVEMLSRQGYSGSPVYVYRSPFDLRTGTLTGGQVFMRFLGLNWGFITDPAEVKEEIVSARKASGKNEKTVRYVSVNTGLNGVVPAWHLRKFLETGQIMKDRKARVEATIERQAIKG